MMKIDFEFISTHRNRNLWSNPCLFEVPWSGRGQSDGLNAKDPVSNQAPIIEWTGQNININATVVSQNEESVIVSAVANLFSRIPNYYQGAQFMSPSSYRINGSKFLSQNGGFDWIQLDVSNSDTVVNDIVNIVTSTIPNTVYVPAGSDLPNAYSEKYLYNDTQGQSTLITGYDSNFHRLITDTIPAGWLATDQYNIRPQLPSVGNFALGGGNTTTTLNLNGIGISVNSGDFIRIISTKKITRIVNFDTTTNIATVSPSLSASLPSGAIVEIMVQTSDNYRTLSYVGTTVGQHEQTTYDINLVSGTLPNTLIKNGGGYPCDYPFLYVEFYDTNHPSQNNLFSNNHTSKSYFKVTTPTGQLLQRREKFTKFTGDLSYKTIRFRPTSNFRVVWRLPTCEEIKFEEQDTQSPQSPNELLQTSVMFNLNHK